VGVWLVEVVADSVDDGVSDCVGVWLVEGVLEVVWVVEVVCDWVGV